MAFDFNDLMNVLDGEDFEERPVDIEDFVQKEEYLGLPPLSENQYTLIKASSQIYKRDTLHNLYGEEAGEKRWRQTMNEVIFQLGKGSGKDYTSTIACAYIVYLLLCLKDPARYYGKPPGDTIDIINVAINAQQANNVFFSGFKNRIKRSPWFADKYTEKQGHFAFDKNINVYSGHSEREAWEGYNVIYVVLDEISGFAIDSTSGNENAKTADAVYKMYRASVDSRFPEFGKVVLLSFPRYKNDFIQQRYNAVVDEKTLETVIRTHTFKLDEDLPDGTDGNEFTVEWEEDHIHSYKIPKVFALKRPTWDVNPLVKIDNLLSAFYADPIDALSRFACMPPESIDAFFKDREKVEEAFVARNGVDNETGAFFSVFQPDPDKEYYIHVDLARKIDRAAVALAHVDRWEQKKINHELTEARPVVYVDAVRYWTPNKTREVDFTAVREYIVSLRVRGFNIKLVTFDRWESDDMIKYLQSVGIKSEKLSVAKKHYQDMALGIHEGRILGPDIEILRKELLTLRLMPNDKIDHPRSGSKDLADATCGAIFNAISHTRKRGDDVIEIQTLSSFKRKHINEEREARKRPGMIIDPPKRKIPDEMRMYFSEMGML
jgi:phage terminase large subunit-like protein